MGSNPTFGTERPAGKEQAFCFWTGNGKIKGMNTFFARIRWKQMGIAAGVLIAVVLLVDFNRRLGDLRRLSEQLENVRASGTAIMHTQETLLTRVAYATSDEAVERWAYEEGRWVRPGEHLVILAPPTDVTPTPALPPFSPTPSWPNWQIWWELFFGKQ